MNTEFAQLEETLKKIGGGKTMYYVANRGNWGDALIRYGTLKFLREKGISFRELTLRKREWLLPILKGGVVLYGGGGAWCKLFNQSPRHVGMLRRRFKVIVLPSTYELRSSIPNVTFFCRDLFESKENSPDATFCHDMSFYIGPRSSPKGSGRGYFFRTDEGSARKIDIPAENVDLSAKGHQYSSMEPFFAEIAKYSTVFTDRLHVAIASCLLGKEVHLYSGSYFKNRSVYLSSIEGYFDNVHFHTEFSL